VDTAYGRNFEKLWVVLKIHSFITEKNNYYSKINPMFRKDRVRVKIQFMSH